MPRPPRATGQTFPFVQLDERPDLERALSALTEAVGPDAAKAIAAFFRVAVQSQAGVFDALVRGAANHTLGGNGAAPDLTTTSGARVQSATGDTGDGRREPPGGVGSVARAEEGMTIRQFAERWSLSERK